MNGDSSMIQARLHNFIYGDGGGANLRQTRMIDSSAVRARRRAAGSIRDDDSRQSERSREGLSKRDQAVVDGNRLPKARNLSLGQTADFTAAGSLLANIAAGLTVIVDNVYDTSAIFVHFVDVGANAVIPPMNIRAKPRVLGHEVYASSNLASGSSVQLSSSGDSPPDMASGPETF